MPSPKPIGGYSDEYQELSRKTAEHNERGDCCVKMIALACGVNYETAHEACESAGRKRRQGMSFNQYEQVFTQFGFLMERVDPREFIDQYPSPHDTLKNVTTHHPDRFKDVWQDGYVYVLHTNQHVTVVINGRNHDWTHGRALRVKSIHKVIPTTQ